MIEFIVSTYFLIGVIAGLMLIKKTSTTIKVNGDKELHKGVSILVTMLFSLVAWPIVAYALSGQPSSKQ